MSREALVVGINQYDHLSKLKAPAEDAEAIAQVLNQHGKFQIRRLPEVVKDDSLQVGQTTQVALAELNKALRTALEEFLLQHRYLPNCEDRYA
jgi:Caspase domain